MNHKAILLLLFAASFPLGATAVEPTEQFAKELVARVDAEYWREISGDKPAGGYLLRFEFDVNADGRNEIFLASTLEGEEYEHAWTIYSPDAQQDYSKIASDVVLSPIRGFYYKTNGSQRELQTVYRNPKFGLGVIDRYAVAASGSVTHTKQELTPEQIGQLDADNWKETFSIGNEVKPTVSKVLLAEYANSHSVQWRAYKTDLGVTEQNQDPADASAIAANSGFTLQNAKQLLGVP